MDVIECILKRRSIRHFLDKEVEDEKIELILKCAMYAPSAKNQRPWHFIVIKNRDILKKVPLFHPHAKMLTEAPLGIAVIADLSSENNKDYFTQDCAASTQNILLSSFALGLGSVWIGIYPREERIKGLRELLKIPDEMMPFSLVAIGYTDIIPEQPERFDPKRIHYDKW